MTDDLREPDNPAAYALAKHIADHPVSTIQAAFRYLNAPITFELREEQVSGPEATEPASEHPPGCWYNAEAAEHAMWEEAMGEPKPAPTEAERVAAAVHEVQTIVNRVREVGTSSAPSDLRQRIAEALADYPVACWTPDNIAERVMRVRDRYLEQLAAGRETWKRKAGEIEADRDRLVEAMDRAKGEHHDTAADTLAAEWHRRFQRLEELSRDPNTSATVLEHVRGELVGLRGALGVLLGGQVQGGTADLLGWSYYQEWRRRQEGQS